MKKIFIIALLSPHIVNAQGLTIEKLWQLGRLAPIGLSVDGNEVNYRVSTPNVAENKSNGNNYSLPIIGGTVKPYTAQKSIADDYDNARISPDGKHIIYSKEVLLDPIIAKNKYKDLPKSNAYIFENLNNRHWDTWEDGAYQHVFLADLIDGKVVNERDLMETERYDCPQKPFGGSEDLIWSPDSKSILYVTKKKFGKDYAISTNTDIYCYDIATQRTDNLTQGMMGYDLNPIFSPDGKTLAWLSMRRDGFEADKQDVITMDWLTRTIKNQTSAWDETVDNMMWSNDSKRIFFTAPYQGTKQLYALDFSPPESKGRKKKSSGTGPYITTITKGEHDINDLVGQKENILIVTKTDMNHASELYTVDIENGNLTQLSHVNDNLYNSITPCKIEGHTTRATDGSKLFSWVVYPPNFDKKKKYPVLLYCQGGPQGSISQFYSYRWNFQLMASQGYIVIVPNRRGCQGWGTQWNEAISKDWGGQAINDYLSAYDDMAKEDYIDKSRAAAVGASYGGYSVFMLAGKHNNRFKSFIAHDGLFDLKSWYGTTEELWFANWDIGGPYWGANVSKSYKDFNPSNFVDQWNTPIMIVQGGTDYRVGIEQGLQAFQAAQLKGIKSRLLYLPEENHWVLKAQNAQVWQREFYAWLSETLK
jgi:dipeptidyl aminopeptidase/acylaminoacyl peptidase